MLKWVVFIGAAFDEIESALSKFDDGPFFLGQLSLVSETLCASILHFFYLEWIEVDAKHSKCSCRVSYSMVDFK